MRYLFSRVRNPRWRGSETIKFQTYPFGGLFYSEIPFSKSIMQSIGERLEEARKRKGVTIREAAEATKIRGEYLNSFENNNFTINVPDIYVRGFLRSYSNFLKVNSDKIITDFNANLIGEAKTAKKEHREFFGRMELQQPLISDGPKESATSDEELRAAEEEEPENYLTKLLGSIDKEQGIKLGIIATVVLILMLLMVWIFRTIVSNDPEIPTTSGLVETPLNPIVDEVPAEQDDIRLIAVGDVRVTVIQKEPYRILLDNHPMQADDTMDVTRSGQVRLEYSAGENLQVEVAGRRMGTGATGRGASRVD